MTKNRLMKSFCLINKYCELKKVSMNSHEIIYKSVFLKDITTPNFLYFTIEQQVLNVARTGLFYNEKVSTKMDK